MPHPIALDTSLDVNAKIIETTNPRALKIHQGKAARSAAFFFVLVPIRAGLRNTSRKPLKRVLKEKKV